MPLNRGELARFLHRVRKDPGGCWYWTGPTTPDGYGKHRTGPGKPERAAHRVSYEHFVGPIPDGMQLDHRCHTDAVAHGTCSGGQGCPHRLCVNPAHLEPVTPSENTTRQDHAQRRKTACPRGHEYTPDNTIRRDGRRYCRTCEAARVR